MTVVQIVQVIAILALLLASSGLPETRSLALSQGNPVATHWLPQETCFRDELVQSDSDYYNCWLDNTGKILTTAEYTNDTLDANYALAALSRYGLTTSNDYLPEAVVNSTEDLTTNGVLTNRIASLAASNQSSKLEQLVLGNYYAGEQNLAYLGSDRILISGNIYSSSNSTVFQTADGFVKESTFSTKMGGIDLYLNATLIPGNPYASVSIQVLPLEAQVTSSDLLYLQVFSSSGQFNNASLYSTSGSYERTLVYDNGSPAAQNGTIIAYSNQQNVFSEDSVAVTFNSSTSQVNDFEHWYQDAAFNSLSWIGIAYNAPQTVPGRLSSPIFAQVYPIEHFDYHLINDTAKYIADNVKDTTVSPPVGFGFISLGLAIASSNQPSNQTLATLAKEYWNFYYSGYSTSVYSTPYARSINTLALASFDLYGCNSTVESFARDFLGNSSGTSIEEDGWGAAAAYQLQRCTGTAEDIALYQSFTRAFSTNSLYFAGILPVSTRPSQTSVPSFTFQYAEAASGLMLGGVPFNDPVVLSLMSAVYQSNVSGIVLNQPYQGELANTETLPAYTLATWLFQSEMSKATGGHSVTGMAGTNITSIVYYGGTLLIGVVAGGGGSVSVSHGGFTETFPVNGTTTTVPISVSTSYTTITQTTRTTITTATTTIESSSTIHSNLTTEAVIGTSVVVIVGLAVAFGLRRKRT